MGKRVVKKVCVVTATRAEYGGLRWIIDNLVHDSGVKLQLVVTGSHLSLDFGMTYHFIEEDGYDIDEKVDMELCTKDIYSIPRSMGLCAERIGKTFQRLQPDIVIVLGDRYELLPIVNTALIYNIPIAHISGGDITKGAIDNEVRNAVTMMSTLHFPGTEESAERIRRMLGNDRYVYTVGEPGLDSFYKFDLWSRKKLANDLGLDENIDWMLVTLHSETKQTMDYNMDMVCHLYQAMLTLPDTQFVVTKANADWGGCQINSFWDSVQSQNIHVIASLGQIRYLSLMHQVVAVLGNSSSGIIEAPFLGIPVINIGNRQEGRHMCKNVISCGSAVEQIKEGLAQINQHRCKGNYWGDGKASSRIVSHIKEFLYKQNK